MNNDMIMPNEEKQQATPNTKSSTCHKKQAPQQIISELKRFDVLLGRGTGPNEHPGNRFFRDNVHILHKEYREAGNRQAKDQVIFRTIDAITSAGGRFLKKAGKRKNAIKGQSDSSRSISLYGIADIRSVIEKTRQAFHYCCRKDQKTGDDFHAAAHPTSSPYNELQGSSLPTLTRRSTTTSKAHVRVRNLLALGSEALEASQGPQKTRNIVAGGNEPPNESTIGSDPSGGIEAGNRERSSSFHSIHSQAAWLSQLRMVTRSEEQDARRIDFNAINSHKQKLLFSACPQLLACLIPLPSMNVSSEDYYGSFVLAAAAIAASAGIDTTAGISMLLSSWKAGLCPPAK